jgi:cullin-4
MQSNRRVQGPAKKVMVIQPFKDIPKLPENFQQEAWGKLDQALNAIFEMHGVCYSQEELYNLVKNLCLHKFTEWLYNQLRDKLTGQIASLVHTLSNSSGSFEKKIEFLLATWKNYSSQISTLRPIFLYLEREYMIHQKNNRIISELGINIFKHYIHTYANVKETLITSALELIRQERQEEVNNAQVSKELLLICIALDLYKTEFEPRYLSQTCAFYCQEAKCKLEEVSVPDYLKYAERRLYEEAHRITQYLDISTTKPSMEAVETNIISQNCVMVLNKGFYDLMDNDRLSDLKLLYSMVGRVNMLKELETKLEQYVKERGAGIIATSEKENVVQSLLNLKSKLETIFRDSFDSNKSFQFTNRRGWDYFINTQSNMVAIEIAKFIDEKLRKSKKNLTDDEIDHLIDNVIYIFRHVLAKDVFEAFYSKRLAKRLLLEKSISSEAEKSVISKLKAECGNNFTNKISGMYKDMEISSTIMESFKERYRHELDRSGILYHVWTLTGSKWPTPSQAKIFLPKNLQDLQNLFNDFYVGINKGKILHWQSSLSHCLLSARFSTRKELFVSLHQAVILLLFNNYEQLSMVEIIQMTGLPEIEVKKELTSLACLKYKILLKSTESKTVTDADVFRVNSEFKSKFLRITINSLQIKETVRDM